MSYSEAEFAKALRIEFDKVDKWLGDPANNVDFTFDYGRTFKEYMEEYWNAEFSLYHISFDIGYPESAAIYAVYEKFWELRTPDFFSI